MEYKCGSCREVSALSPRAKFCPVCGSSSLILVVKEQAEPHQKETIGVYNSATMKATVENALISGSHYTEIVENTEPPATKEEEDKPRRRR